MLVDRILDAVILTILFTVIADSKPAKSPKPRYFIPSIPGLVPVYIRPGDTPLQDINQPLAEAFAFNAVKHGRIAFGREINAILNEKTKGRNLFDISDLSDDVDFSLSKEDSQKNEVMKKRDEEEKYTHVQKIPRH